MRKLFLLALLLLVPALGLAEGLDLIERVGDNVYFVSPGTLTIQTTGTDKDIDICTDMVGNNACWTIEGADADLVPDTDDNVDIGSSTIEVHDIFVDGTIHADTLDVDVAFGSDAGINFNTTDTGIGADAADQTVKVCGGINAVGCDAEAIGAWAVFEGINFGGAGVGGAIQIEGGAGDGTSDVKIGTNHDDADILLAGGTTQATKWTIEGDTGDLLSAGGVVIQAEKTFFAAAHGSVGGTSTVGWVNTGGAADAGHVATLAQSATADTFVIPLSGFNIGDTITGFKVIGQIESAGNTATLDAAMRKLTMAAGDPADAAFGTACAITQVSVSADTEVAQEKTGCTEVIASGVAPYVLVTATTAASTDIQLAGVEVYYTKGN